MDDDEEVIFDQQNLLAEPERPVRISKTPVSCRRLVKTVFLCAAFFGLVSILILYAVIYVEVIC